MLSDIIAPGRLRAGDPQALAALVAVAGWPVVAYCDRAGAGDDVADAVVLAFVTFRRRTIQADDEAVAGLELLLLESVRDAVDDVRGAAPADAAAQAAEQAFARASPRPLSPRLATQILRALVDAAPIDGERSAVRAAAERSYADAYGAAEEAPVVSGEEGLAPASPLLLRAAQAGERAPAPRSPTARVPVPPPRRAGKRAAGGAAPPSGETSPPRAGGDAPAGSSGAPLLDRLRALSPAGRAGAFAGALLLVFVFVTLLAGDDDPVPPDATATAPAASPTTATPAAGLIRGAVHKPLVASGARFEVVPITDAAWAREIRADTPRRRARWLTIAVRARNLNRGDLVLRALGYRLRSAGGLIVGPRVVDVVVEGPRQGLQGRLPIGTRASVHLGFEVPSQAGSLSLVFEPGGLDGPTVLMPIGA